MKNKFKKNNEKGFAIALSVLMLVIMSLMGVTLVLITSNDHNQNSKRDYYQQTLYAAETGIAEAKKYMESVSQTTVPTNRTKWTGFSGNWCNPGLFKSLDTNNVYRINDKFEEFTLDRKIAASGEELTRLQKYRYYYFITHAPDSNGSTTSPRFGTVASSSGTGSSAAVGTSYKNQGSATAYYYSIFSCGKGEDNTIVALDSVVYIVK